MWRSGTFTELKLVVGIYGARDFVSKGSSKCTDPEVGTCLECLRKKKKVNVGMESKQERKVEKDDGKFCISYRGK